MRINSRVATEALKREVVTLSPEESHHLARVLRVQPGQALVLFDGCGSVADAEVVSVSKGTVEARILARRTVPKPAVELELVQAVPRMDRWELVLQKAVELGAASIRPVLTQHTEYKPNAKRQERWERIVESAAQQCEIRWLPRLCPVCRFDEIITQLETYDLVLIGSLYPGAKPLREVKLSGTKRVALLIGPEGDFSAEEVASAVAAGAVPVSFGDRILRTETAALFGLSVLSCALL